MVKIMSDSSTLYSIEQGKEIDVLISPLCVTIAGKTYREFEEISSEEFLSLIDDGHIPTSSQPAIGEVIEGYESYGKDEVINISMAHGLSGTYESALMAADQASNAENITVVNSKTLCGPHRYMVRVAQCLARGGAAKKEVLAALDTLIKSTKSFLVPDDFDYLKRGGRLSPLAANMIGLLKAMPVLVESENGEKLDPHGIHRKEKALHKDMISSLMKHGVGSDWLISISHANNMKRALGLKDALKEAFAKTEIEILELSPVFITQGGPRCVAIQAIQKSPLALDLP